MSSVASAANDMHGQSIDDDIHLTLAPHIQAYLNETGRRYSCCSVMLPVTFERAAHNSWLNPIFDSSILEEQYQTTLFPHIRMRYRFSLSYILLFSITWFLYFMVDRNAQYYWRSLSFFFSLLSLIVILTMCFTHSGTYKNYHVATSAITAIILCIASLAFLTYTDVIFSPLGHYAICLEIVLLIYTTLPMKLWLSASIAITYTIIFEIVTHLVVASNMVHGSSSEFSLKILLLRVLCHASVHLIGLHILIMNMVRMRGTFMKIGQNLLVRRQLEMEKKLKEKMIHSVMPPKVADLLLNEAAVDNNSECALRRESNLRPRSSNDVQSLFRPFHMHSMDNVSILFADIVGFTRMSSTKTAEQLVEILNDLFERFDELCQMHGCEKISTLGDCYYCVSGCPEPRSDHAVCCVEMGLDMIEAMRRFDAQRHEGVKMRVGVHTGTVLCGIVGTRRVKFDVWSNDVNLANKMESTGKPEQVHVSEATAKFLEESYFLQEGEYVYGHLTYFVVGRRKDNSCTNSLCNTSEKNSCKQLLPNELTQRTQSITNLSIVQPSVPPASPNNLSASLNPSPVLSIKRRLSTFSIKINKKSQIKEFQVENNILQTNDNVRNEKPKIIITTKSLSESLDKDDIQIQTNEDTILENNSKNKTQLSTRRNKIFIKILKIIKIFRKLDKIKNAQEKYNSTEVAINLENITSQPNNSQIDSAVLKESIYNKSHQITITDDDNNDNKTKDNILEIPQKLNLSSYQISASISPPIRINRSPENNSHSPGHYSMFDDIIDIRSYISQSRSDISPFDRSGSYRSRVDHNLKSELSPRTRLRSGTLNITRQDQVPCVQPLLPPSTIASEQLTHSRNSSILPDGLSISPSATSRKDSGIKSNSRRSSIQHQILALNQNINNQHRVSGYFTSSTSSITNIDEIRMPPPPPLLLYREDEMTDPLAACLQHLRKQSDLQLIRCVRDNAKSQRSYLVKPPLKKFSLFFKSNQMEKDFRSKAHRFGNENESEGPPTLATPRYNTCIDILVGFFVYLCISVSLILITSNTITCGFYWWMALFISFTGLQSFAFILFIQQMCRRYSSNLRDKNTNSKYRKYMDYIFEKISNWYPWHICLAIFMASPVILIIVNFLLLDLEQLEAFEYHYGILIFVCIVHSGNFMQLNCWMRNILAFLAAQCFVAIAISQLMVSSNRLNIINIESNSIDSALNSSKQIVNSIMEEMKWFQSYHVETYLDLFLILVLIWFLNREFEIGYRLTFYGNAVAKQDKIRVQNMKNQADMLLHNIIPKHVAEQLKNTAKYSENHQNVGIIFASIVNFNELYDESYLGGKEYLRVLNELVGDFDELLSRPEFKCVEKIKTIGSTFMAASGLDPSKRTNNNEHIHALMEFSIAMKDVIDAFNIDLLEFNLILRVGFNVGDVTAGVIGTSKLHYDIWGDAVNVASRMDSTGVPNRIQVGEDCLPFLQDKFVFEPRGSVYVKGKDNMEVYLFTHRKTDSNNCYNIYSYDI